MQKLLGFLPDVDPTIQGVITDCTNLIPYEYGMMGSPTGLDAPGTPALAAACFGAAIAEKLDGTRRTFAATSDTVYELIADVWTDVSVGTGYTALTDDRWCFAQFGDATLATNGVEVIQRSNGTGAFADIATAPAAQIVFSVGAFVMALNTTDATYGASPDRWWCCASFDDTDWTPSVSTLATTGRIVSTPGEILAGGRLGEYAVVYKAKAIYIGQFVGAPAVWDWQQVPGGDAGCVGQEAWCDVGGAHFLVGSQNFYLFDGSRPVPIGNGEVRQWFYDNSNPKYRFKTKCMYDRQTNTVWTFYCSVNSTTPDRAIVYHMVSKQWGLVTLSIEAVLNYISPGVSIDDLPDYSATIDGLSGYSFNSQFWIEGGYAISVFNTSHQLQLLSGPCGTSSFTTGDAGDDDRVTLLSKIRLRFAPSYAPTTASVETFSKMTEGASLTAVATGDLDDGKFDVLQSARWHRARFTFTGDVRVLGLVAKLTPEGDA